METEDKLMHNFLGEFINLCPVLLLLRRTLGLGAAIRSGPRLQPLHALHDAAPRIPIASTLSNGICIAAFNCKSRRMRSSYVQPRCVIDNGSFGRHCGFALHIHLINGKVSQSKGLFLFERKQKVPFDEFGANEALSYEYSSSGGEADR